MKKWKIYFLLFGLVLSFFTSILTAPRVNAVESYKISPGDDRTVKRSLYARSNILQEVSINPRYYFYAKNSYSENIDVIYYICEYTEDYETVKNISDCGLFMTMESGYFKIKLRASAYGVGEYSRRTGKFSLNWDSSIYSDTKNAHNYETIASFTDNDFDNGLTLLGGATLKQNSWNRSEGGFLFGPVGGNSGGSPSGEKNQGGGGFNLDFGGFVNGIVDGITAFFRPLVDSLERFGGWANDFFRSTVGSFKRLVDWIGGFFQNLRKWIIGLVIPSESDLNQRVDNIKKGFADSSSRFIGLLFSGSNFFELPKFADCSGSNSSITSTIINTDRSLIKQDGYLFYPTYDVQLCSIPKGLISIARHLLWFAIGWIMITRIGKIIPVLLGSCYVWDRYMGKEDK